eukprot:Rhum_TRINITY_DN14841_c8_g2::Rhum_TRINITY_DN14841_c8_g2_i2::g.122447::m.122447
MQKCASCTRSPDARSAANTVSNSALRARWLSELRYAPYSADDGRTPASEHCNHNSSASVWRPSATAALISSRYVRVPAPCFSAAIAARLFASSRRPQSARQPTAASCACGPTAYPAAARVSHAVRISSESAFFCRAARRTRSMRRRSVASACSSCSLRTPNLRRSSPAAAASVSSEGWRWRWRLLLLRPEKQRAWCSAAAERTAGIMLRGKRRKARACTHKTHARTQTKKKADTRTPARTGILSSQVFPCRRRNSEREGVVKWGGWGWAGREEGSFGGWKKQRRVYFFFCLGSKRNDGSEASLFQYCCFCFFFSFLLLLEVPLSLWRLLLTNLVHVRQGCAHAEVDPVCVCVCARAYAKQRH